MARDHFLYVLLLAPSSVVVAVCLLLQFLRYVSPDVSSQYSVLTGKVMSYYGLCLQC